MKQRTKHNEQVIDQFSQQAESYSRLTASIKSDRAAKFRALVLASPEDDLLDVCCGAGSLTLDLAPFVHHATGIDLTPAMLDQARAAQAEKGITNVAWVTGDADPLPFAAGSFSLVVCSSAFHHLEQPQRVFDEMVRVCRSGGRIAIRDVTPSPQTVEAYDAIEKLRDPSHSHALTADELLKLGSGVGVGEPQLSGSIAADLSLDAILATSFPPTCSRDEIRALFREDAVSGQNRLGFSAKLIKDQVHVSYPMSTVIWTKD